MPAKRMYAIVDIETTGGMSKRDKITEIGIVVTDGQKVIKKFSSLVNPERSIPLEIIRITGITNDMVSDAPKFYEIAKEVVEYTEDCIFVAHNVRFDYSFLREEFSKLGYTYTKKQLCTVRLSRKAFPGLKSYSLGNLINHFGISVDARHRALDDALATTEIFHMILSNEENKEAANVLINLGLKESKLPNGISIQQLHDLPEEHGVYYFINGYGKVVYVGKSKNIKKRVFQHFTKNNQKALNMVRMVHEISYELLGNELCSLLYETQEIKRLRPEINKAQKNLNYPYFIHQTFNDNGYYVFEILKAGKKNENGKNLLCRFKSKMAAKSMLAYLRRELNLCGHLTNLETGSFSCNYYQLGSCYGACSKMESAIDYNERAILASSLIDQKFDKDFIVIGNGRNDDEKSVVLVEEGYYKGMGFASKRTLDYGIEEILECINYVNQYPENNRIIRQYMHKSQYDIIEL